MIEKMVVGTIVLVLVLGLIITFNVVVFNVISNQRELDKQFIIDHNCKVIKRTTYVVFNRTKYKCDERVTYET